MPKSWIAGGAVLACLPLLASCADRKADEKAIVDGETRWGMAYVTGDVNGAEALLAKDFSGVTDQGMVYDKPQALDDIRHGPQSTTSDTLGPVTVRFYGATAVAQGSEFGTEGAPEKKPFRRVWTDVWVHQSGAWRIVAAEDVNPDAH